MWIVHDKVSVSKEFNETKYTSLSKRQTNIETLSQLLALIKPKGRAVIMYDGDNDISLVLVDPKCDVEQE